MINLKRIQQLQYTFHVLLTLKNKTLIISLLQILFILLLTNLIDYTYCMTNENETISNVSDDIQSISELSSIFQYDETYMDDMIFQGYDHLSSHAYHNHVPQPDNPIANALGPMFEYYKGTHPRLDAESLNSTPLVEKIKMLEQDYFTTNVENTILEKALEDQGAQLMRRHEALLEAKGTIKSLTQENLELKNQIDELQRLLRESLRK